MVNSSNNNHKEPIRDHVCLKSSITVTIPVILYKIERLCSRFSGKTSKFFYQEYADYMNMLAFGMN